MAVIGGTGPLSIRIDKPAGKSKGSFCKDARAAPCVVHVLVRRHRAAERGDGFDAGFDAETPKVSFGRLTSPRAPCCLGQSSCDDRRHQHHHHHHRHRHHHSSKPIDGKLAQSSPYPSTEKLPAPPVAAATSGHLFLSEPQRRGRDTSDELSTGTPRSRSESHAEVMVEVPLFDSETVDTLRLEFVARWHVRPEDVVFTDASGKPLPPTLLLSSLADRPQPAVYASLYSDHVEWIAHKGTAPSSATLSLPTMPNSPTQPDASTSTISTSTSLILQLARDVHFERIDSLAALLETLDDASLFASLPVWLALNSPAVNAQLASRCCASPELRLALSLLVHERQPFADLATLVTPVELPADPLFSLLLSDRPLHQDHLYSVAGARHPLCFTPVDVLRVDHVFKRSLARPIIVSLLRHSLADLSSVSQSSQSTSVSQSSSQSSSQSTSVSQTSTISQSSVDQSTGVSQSSSQSLVDQSSHLAVTSHSSSMSSLPSTTTSPSPLPPSRSSSETSTAGSGSDEVVSPRFLVKRGEDIYHETCIQLVFRLFNEVWTEQLPESLRPRVACFAELPVGRSLGLLEIVEDCLSLERVELNNFADVTDHEQFLVTSCGWILAAYLLGLSDRHRDNTLVRRSDSTAIPIDFGFMLGVQAPSVNTYKVTVSSEMYQYLLARGAWPRFCAMFLCGFYVLRHHVSFVVSLVRLLFRGFRDVDFLEKFLALRFLLDEPIDYKALQQVKRFLRHAPVCLDTKIKINSLALSKAILASFGRTPLVRMFVGNAVANASLKSTSGHLHYDTVPWKLPDFYPAELPEQLLFLLRELQTNRRGSGSEVEKLAFFGHLPVSPQEQHQKT